jgi:glycogen debranching enzyme
LLRKAVSVMKVNTHSACGAMARRWTTPDRWPHRNMWLWDSGFHAIGMAYIDIGWAEDALLAMLEQVTPDGMLPHMVCADGTHSRITQPPILAWATRHVLRHGGSLTWAKECQPRLHAYLDWIRRNRDRNGNHIPEWFIEGNPLCRCGESGADNSSVYDRAVLLDAPDFGSFLCNDWQCLADIDAQLGDSDAAAQCRAHAAAVADAVRDCLWSEEDQFFCHRDFSGGFVRVRAFSGFMPLFAGIASPAQAKALAAHLANPVTFATAFPVASESIDSGTYCKDMWRGPTWINTNYLIWCGLRRYGLRKAAAELRQRTLAQLRRWYEAEGCLFEFYDSLGVTSPRGLDRKQRLSSGRGLAPISDYHWTAALAVAFMLGAE